MKTLIKLLVFVLLVSILYDFFRTTNPYNDTDDILNKKRSGMRLHIDHNTGCQYLSRAFGSLTPRLLPDGKHFGCKDYKRMFP